MARGTLPAPRLEREGPDLRGRGFSPYISIELECGRCGAVRLNTSVYAGQEAQPCPKCDRLSQSSAVLAWGFTRKSLPVWSVIFPSMRYHIDHVAGDKRATTRTERPCIVCGRVFPTEGKRYQKICWLPDCRPRGKHR